MPNDFPHLPLLQTEAGPAYLYGGGRPNPQTKKNLEQRDKHGKALRKSAKRAITSWKANLEAREAQGLPPIPPHVPVLLQVDPNLASIDFLRSAFNFEIVSEQDDGFVIIASEDLDLKKLLERIKAFPGDDGAKNIASVHRLYEDENRELRLERLLSPQLLQTWGGLQDAQHYVVDLGVECIGTVNLRPFDDRGADEDAERKKARLEKWESRRDEAWSGWDDLKYSREESLVQLVQAHGGDIFTIAHEDTYAISQLPDSFTVRVRVSGAGLRDIVFNFPFLFEVVEPDDVDSGFPTSPNGEEPEELTLVPPDPEAPRVCVIDSGIQEAHILLAGAILPGSSACFLPNEAETETADYVSPNGHGTRVAGAILFRSEVPKQGNHKFPFWLLNARILDKDGKLPANLFPPSAITQIIAKYAVDPHNVRLFNHSVSASGPCRTRHMSAWAAEIDRISYERDVLFVQAAGNIPAASDVPTNPGVQDHLASGREYPEFLYQPSSRVANPAQSLNALSVGSVSLEELATPTWSSFGPSRSPSSYSRTGPGIWATVKPDVVELGGDQLRDTGDPPQVATPAEGAQCYPELVRTTFSPGPSSSRDNVGTSFAAPLVTNLVGRLIAEYPDEPTLLYRALVANCASWPCNPDKLAPAERVKALKSYGFGIPDPARAIANEAPRVALTTSGDCRIRAKEAHVFQVPIPAELRSPDKDHEILLQVTLAYSARPRRTRRRISGYLSTWVDWRVSNSGEPFSSFRARALRGEQAAKEDHESFDWALTSLPQFGAIEGTRRSAGTLQKDWAIVRSHELPETLGIAVIGHEGWDADREANAKYALVVSLEAVDEDVELYQPIRLEVEALQQAVEAEIEAPGI